MWQHPSLDHLVAMSDDTGIIQHASLDVPNRSTGYCVDDVSRAFIVACLAASHDRLREDALRLARIYLAFLHDAQLPDGRFHNFMSFDRRWLDEVGSEDSMGRAIWALGVGVRCAPKVSWRTLCDEMITRAAPRALELTFIRAKAYAVLGLTQVYDASGRTRSALQATLRELGNSLLAAHAASTGPGWDWFEDSMTYDNARLPEACLRLGMVLEDRRLLDLGLRTLDFLESVTVEDRTFVPIGNMGWHGRDGRRARYGQQPLEAAAMIDAALVAHAATGELRFRRLAEAALEWFYGRNSRDAVMASGGGCFDGLEELGVNRNMGAESTLAYLAGALVMAQPATEVLRIAR
jgi:hypothetical protein